MLFFYFLLINCQKKKNIIIKISKNIDLGAEFHFVMGKIILIRHGESENNVRAYSKNMDFPSTKSEDPLLSVKGRVQVELLIF